MSKHTPGPWSVQTTQRPHVAGHWREIVADKLVVAEVYEDDEPHEPYSPLPKEAEANARLIAAAPELLEALKGFALNRAHLRTEDPFDGALSRLLDMADAAIAKAEGSA